MADTTIPKVVPEEQTDKHPPICRHVWVTAAPYQARCTACGFLAPITTEEV